MTNRMKSKNDTEADSELDVLEREIDHSRIQISNTIAAIEGELRPETMAFKAVEEVQNRAQALYEKHKPAVTRTLLDSAKKNAVPVALLAIGMGLLLSRKKEKKF